eukprot:COSAG01_NODE_39691_length_473_cov_0.863636_1_plen_29_part_10
MQDALLQWQRPESVTLFTIDRPVPLQFLL